jgi:hypothetical protein
MLLKHRNLTGTLILNLALLSVLTVLMTGLGLVLLILPGLFAWVSCSLSLWYLLAHFSMKVGVDQPIPTNLMKT